MVAPDILFENVLDFYSAAEREREIERDRVRVTEKEREVRSEEGDKKNASYKRRKSHRKDKPNTNKLLRRRSRINSLSIQN